MVLNRRVTAQSQNSSTSSAPFSHANNDKKGRNGSFGIRMIWSATKAIMFAAFFYYMGLKQSTGSSAPDFQGIYGVDTASQQNNVQNVSTEQMPIMQSISRGFHPVFVYSQATSTRKPKEMPTYSQAKQDMLVLALMDANDEKIRESQGPSLRSTPRSNRYFVDLASNDATVFSNSYLLEKNGWNGLCLEPNPIYWYGLAAYRKCTIVGAFVGGTQEEDGKEVDVQLSNGVFGGIVGEGMDNNDKKKNEKRNLVSILTVFQETNVPKIIDYFSLDVEGAETIVMDKFPWGSYKFKFITIERPKDDLKNMLEANGYIQAMEVTDWGETLWIHEESVALTKKEINDFVDKNNLRCTWKKGACRGWSWNVRVLEMGMLTVFNIGVAKNDE